MTQLLYEYYLGFLSFLCFPMAPVSREQIKNESWLAKRKKNPKSELQPTPPRTNVEIAL